MIHLDPDFAKLNRNQREIALKSLYVITTHADSDRQSGITQLRLVHAIGSTLLGVDLSIEVAEVKEDEIKNHEHVMKGGDEVTKHHLFKLFTLVKLVEDQMPEKITKTL